MNEVCNYTVPDYYPDFACKMGACRTSCCVGWPVSISMSDYFRLLGVGCRRQLRERLDCALHLSPRPTADRYAQILHRFDGDCHLRLPDGRCALHAGLGEGALPATCRLYPRGVRRDAEPECSCANSCEAVVELLMRHPAPLRFVQQPCEFDVPATPGAAACDRRVRLMLIGIVQRRDMPLPRRLMALGLALRALEGPLAANDRPAIEHLLSAPLPAASDMSDDVTAEHLALGLRTAERMMDMLDGGSDSISAYGAAALEHLGRDARTLERYRAAKAHFEALLPGWPSVYENLLVNHMFFTRFPFADGRESLHDEFLAICAVYTLLRFLGVGYMATRSEPSAFADAMAAAFRLIDHTDFHRYSAGMLRELDCASPERVFTIINL